MGDIKVSIIISVYKAEKYLRRCIDSVISQTENAIEIILVNDGSPDSSGEIAEEYAAQDNRIKVIHKPNGGVASARNCGLEAAQGKYIAFVDSDDWIDHNFAEVLLKRAGETNADIVRCNVCYEYEQGDSKVQKDHFQDGFFIEKKDFKYHIYNKMIAGIQLNSVWRTLYKKDVVKDIRFQENLRTGEDLVFSIKAYTNAKRFAYTKEPLYHYFQAQGGLTHSGLALLTKLKCNIYISKVLMEYIKIWDMYSIKNIILIYRRLLNITFSKAIRIFKDRFNIV